MVGFRLTGKKGFVINIAGIAVQVQKCDTVEARLRTEEKCSVDIPVTILGNNKTSYMDPLTHVMRETTSQLPCDDTQNPYIQVRDQWCRLTALGFFPAGIFPAGLFPAGIFPARDLPRRTFPLRNFPSPGFSPPILKSIFCSLNVYFRMNIGT